MSNLFMERYEAARTKRLASQYGTKIPEFTMGDMMDAIWSVEDEEDMRPFFNSYVEYLKSRPDCDDPEGVARANIGWMFGEGMAQDRINMWTRATQSAHPVFGSMATRPSPEEALQQGIDASRRVREVQDRVN
jgi:hypothetical protein